MQHGFGASISRSIEAITIAIAPRQEVALQAPTAIQTMLTMAGMRRTGYHTNKALLASEEEARRWYSEPGVIMDRLECIKYEMEEEMETIVKMRMAQQECATAGKPSSLAKSRRLHSRKRSSCTGRIRDKILLQGPKARITW